MRRRSSCSSPNFFGCIESVEEIAETAHAKGGVLIASSIRSRADCSSRPAHAGRTSSSARASPRIPLAYGGPYLGFIACREAFLRKMPGRLVGASRDKNGRRGFCLTLQTREQHIRRERATSNVCTNQGLLALRAAVYLSAMGRSGISQVAKLCLDKSHYAASRIAELDGFELRFASPFFKEFVVRRARMSTRSCNTPAPAASWRAWPSAAGSPIWAIAF